MLTSFGKPYQHCDGISRRSFLSFGGLALGGLSLPALLRAESASKSGTQKSVIMIFLSGGAPHQDMYDLKMGAPAEVRGEFQPISTNVPGIQICEHLPRMAQMMDRLVPIRSIVGSEGRHSAFQCLTGRKVTQQPAGGWPSFGSCVSSLQGPVHASVPPFVSLSPRMKGAAWGDPGQPGYAGQKHAPFAPNHSGAANLVLQQGISLDTLGNRQLLLGQLDTLRRAADADGSLEAMDAYQRQAYGILTSSKLADALDLDLEDSKVRDRYGRGSNKPAGYGDAGPLLNDYFLAARRLVEAGVRVVTLAYGRWDWHGRPHGTTFENARGHIPMLDQGVSALVDDLYDRGLDKDVTVLVWGEFGRTPHINANGGRDHWPRVSSALLACGGLRGGQVIGSTDRLGGEAHDRPVHFQEVFATLYRQLGINVNHATIDDLNGRPRYLIDHAQYRPLPEVF
ncbi:MAG: DUF1501 domain-containing protein [Pirellulaceae bacterium]